jgi:hypothetical protein
MLIFGQIHSAPLYPPPLQHYATVQLYHQLSLLFSLWLLIYQTLLQIQFIHKLLAITCWFFGG